MATDISSQAAARSKFASTSTLTSSLATDITDKSSISSISKLSRYAPKSKTTAKPDLSNSEFHDDSLLHFISPEPRLIQRLPACVKSSVGAMDSLHFRNMLLVAYASQECVVVAQGSDLSVLRSLRFPLKDKENTNGFRKGLPSSFQVSAVAFREADAALAVAFGATIVVFSGYDSIPTATHASNPNSDSGAPKPGAAVSMTPTKRTTTAIVSVTKSSPNDHTTSLPPTKKHKLIAHRGSTWSKVIFQCDLRSIDGADARISTLSWNRKGDKLAAIGSGVFVWENVVAKPQSGSSASVTSSSQQTVWDLFMCINNTSPELEALGSLTLGSISPEGSLIAAASHGLEIGRVWRVAAVSSSDTVSVQPGQLVRNKTMEFVSLKRKATKIGSSSSAGGSASAASSYFGAELSFGRSGISSMSWKPRGGGNPALLTTDRDGQMRLWAKVPKALAGNENSWMEEVARSPHVENTTRSCGSFVQWGGGGGAAADEQDAQATAAMHPFVVQGAAPRPSRCTHWIASIAGGSVHVWRARGLDDRPRAGFARLEPAETITDESGSIWGSPVLAANLQHLASNSDLSELNDDFDTGEYRMVFCDPSDIRAGSGLQGSRAGEVFEGVRVLSMLLHAPAPLSTRTRENFGLVKAYPISNGERRIRSAEPPEPPDYISAFLLTQYLGRTLISRWDLCSSASKQGKAHSAAPTNENPSSVSAMAVPHSGSSVPSMAHEGSFNSSSVASSGLAKPGSSYVDQTQGLQRASSGASPQTLVATKSVGLTVSGGSSDIFTPQLRASVGAGHSSPVAFVSVLDCAAEELERTVAVASIGQSGDVFLWGKDMPSSGSQPLHLCGTLQGPHMAVAMAPSQFAKLHMPRVGQEDEATDAVVFAVDCINSSFCVYALVSDVSASQKLDSNTNRIARKVSDVKAYPHGHRSDAIYSQISSMFSSMYTLPKALQADICKLLKVDAFSPHASIVVGIGENGDSMQAWLVGRSFVGISEEEWKAAITDPQQQRHLVSSIKSELVVLSMKVQIKDVRSWKRVSCFDISSFAKASLSSHLDDRSSKKYGSQVSLDPANAVISKRLESAAKLSCVVCIGFDNGDFGIFSSHINLCEMSDNGSPSLELAFHPDIMDSLAPDNHGNVGIETSIPLISVPTGCNIGKHGQYAVVVYENARLSVFERETTGSWNKDFSGMAVASDVPVLRAIDISIGIDVQGSTLVAASLLTKDKLSTHLATKLISLLRKRKGGTWTIMDVFGSSEFGLEGIQQLSRSIVSSLRYVSPGVLVAVDGSSMAVFRADANVEQAMRSESQDPQSSRLDGALSFESKVLSPLEPQLAALLSGLDTPLIPDYSPIFGIRMILFSGGSLWHIAQYFRELVSAYCNPIHMSGKSLDSVTGKGGKKGSVVPDDPFASLLGSLGIDDSQDVGNDSKKSMMNGENSHTASSALPPSGRPGLAAHASSSSGLARHPSLFVHPEPISLGLLSQRGEPGDIPIDPPSQVTEILEKWGMWHFVGVDSALDVEQLRADLSALVHCYTKSRALDRSGSIFLWSAFSSLEKASETALSGCEFSHAFYSTSSDAINEIILAKISEKFTERANEEKRGKSGSRLATELGLSFWAMCRRLGVGFWLRSTTGVMKLVETISRCMFSLRQDPEDVALWFVLQRKEKALAALYRSKQNKKVADFLMRDFRQPENRIAASKNAFVLVGKHEYEKAVAFMILANDVSGAANICLNRMDDPQLAILITRVMGSRESDDGMAQSILKETLEGVIKNSESACPPRFQEKSMALWMLGNHSGAMRTVAAAADWLTSPLASSKYISDPSTCAMPVEALAHALVMTRCPPVIGTIEADNLLRVCRTAAIPCLLRCGSYSAATICLMDAINMMKRSGEKTENGVPSDFGDPQQQSLFRKRKSMAQPALGAESTAMMATTVAKTTMAGAAATAAAAAAPSTLSIFDSFMTNFAGDAYETDEGEDIRNRLSVSGLNPDEDTGQSALSKDESMDDMYSAGTGDRGQAIFTLVYLKEVIMEAIRNRALMHALSLKESSDRLVAQIQRDLDDLESMEMNVELIVDAFSETALDLSLSDYSDAAVGVSLVVLKRCHESLRSKKDSMVVLLDEVLRNALTRAIFLSRSILCMQLNGDDAASVLKVLEAVKVARSRTKIVHTLLFRAYCYAPEVVSSLIGHTRRLGWILGFVQSFIEGNWISIADALRKSMLDNTLGLTEEEEVVVNDAMQQSLEDSSDGGGGGDSPKLSIEELRTRASNPVYSNLIKQGLNQPARLRNRGVSSRLIGGIDALDFSDKRRSARSSTGGSSSGRKIGKSVQSRPSASTSSLVKPAQARARSGSGSGTVGATSSDESETEFVGSVEAEGRKVAENRVLTEALGCSILCALVSHFTSMIILGLKRARWHQLQVAQASLELDSPSVVRSQEATALHPLDYRILQAAENFEAVISDSMVGWAPFVPFGLCFKADDTSATRRSMKQARAFVSLWNAVSLVPEFAQHLSEAATVAAAIAASESTSANARKQSRESSDYLYDAYPVRFSVQAKGPWSGQGRHCAVFREEGALIRGLCVASSDPPTIAIAAPKNITEILPVSYSVTNAPQFALSHQQPASALEGQDNHRRHSPPSSSQTSLASEASLSDPRKAGMRTVASVHQFPAQHSSSSSYTPYETLIRSAQMKQQAANADALSIRSHSHTVSGLPGQSTVGSQPIAAVPVVVPSSPAIAPRTGVSDPNRRRLSRHSVEVSCLASHPLRQRFAAGGNDGTISLWAFGETHSLAEISENSLGRVSSLRFSAYGDALLAVYASGYVVLIDNPDSYCGLRRKASSQPLVINAYGNRRASDAVFLDEKHVIAAVGNPGGAAENGAGSIGHSLRIYDTREVSGSHSRSSWSCRVNKGDEARCLTLLEDRVRVVTGGCNGTLSVVDLRAQSTVAELPAHDDEVTCLCLEVPRGRAMVSGCRNGDIKLWDSRTLLELDHIKGAHPPTRHFLSGSGFGGLIGSHGVTGVYLSDRSLISCGGNGVVNIWGRGWE